MARAIWTGTLSFGLVNIPVSLYPATEERSIRFNQFQAGTSDRVRNKRVNERTGDEVPYEEIVKGYDLGGGEFVLLTPEDLASVAPGRTRTIEVSDFVEARDIDPVYFERPYYLGPQKQAGARAYALLCRAMGEAGKVAVGTLVLRDKQHLVTVRPHAGALVLETLRFADEVRDPADVIGELPEAAFDERELEMAKLLIDSMSTAWDPTRYYDSYRERLEELIERRRSGAVVVAEQPPEAPAPVVDLLAALQASVEAARAGVAPRTSGSGEPGPGASGARTAKRAKAAGEPATAARPARRRATASRERATGGKGRAAPGREPATEPAKQARPRRKAS